MTAARGPFRTTLSRLVYLIMVAGQLALLAATATEGAHGFSTAPHVERYGVDQHYAHSEATCVTCIVLSLHARGERSYTPLPNVAPVRTDTPVAGPAVVIIQRDVTENPSRAPPAFG